MSDIFNIDDLIVASNKFQTSLNAIENLRSAEIDLATSMRGNCANKLLLIEEMGNLLINDEAVVDGLQLMKATYTIWKQRVDNKIAELKNQEFPSEITL